MSIPTLERSTNTTTTNQPKGRFGHHSQAANAAANRLTIKTNSATSPVENTAVSNIDPVAIATAHKTFKVGNLVINVFNEASGLNQIVAQQLIPEFKKPGLIILPADSTHGHEKGRPDGEIYKLINQHFKKQNKPDAGLRVTHMDELNSSNPLEGSEIQPEKFSGKIQQWLPNILKPINDRFLPINPNNLEAYKAFVEQNGGARVIVGGVGAEVPPHIAYIGEATDTKGKPVINDDPLEIILRKDEAERRGVKSAVTMGMSFFKSENLEKVIISAKGEKKAESIVYALKDALLDKAPKGKSAFGQLIRDFANSEVGAKTQLVLNLDKDAFDKVSKNPAIMAELKELGRAKIKAEAVPNPYTQEWQSRVKAAREALIDVGQVQIEKLKPQAFSEKEFNQLKEAYADDQPTGILAIGPFGSLYRRLIAPGLFKLNEAFEKFTGKRLNLHWLLSDIDKPGGTRKQTTYDASGLPKTVTVDGTKNINGNLARMKAAANSSKEVTDGKLGYKEEAKVDYIPASELVKQLKTKRQANPDGKQVIEYQGKKYPIDLALVTSLVDTHLKYAKLLGNKSIPTITEKPMVAPTDTKQVEAMHEVVSDKKNNFAADFFPYVDSMRVLEEHPELVKGMGKLVAIHGTCTEPGNIEPGRGWLINKKKAGGGIFTADTAPHPIAWADYALNWYLKKFARVRQGVDTANARIRAVDTYRLRDEDLKKVIPEKELKAALKIDPNIETHGTLNAILDIPEARNESAIADSIDLRISAGKGAAGRLGAAGNQKHDKPSLGLELVFERGRVELSTGYTVGDKSIYNPYVARVPNKPSTTNPVKIYEIRGAKLGYNNMLVDWLLAAKGIFTDRLKAVSSSAKSSMTLLHKTFDHIVAKGIKPQIYSLGDTLKPKKADIAHGWVNPLVKAKNHDFLGTKNF